MIQSEFKALVASNEMDLNKIAKHFGIDRKYKWEESLRLGHSELQGIIGQPEYKMVYIFHFGSLVFLNFQHHDIMDFMNYVKKIEVGIIYPNLFKYVDDYKIESSLDGVLAINNEYMVTKEQADYQLDIVSIILAKSVALEKIEMEISSLLDDIEHVVNDLHQGKLTVSDEKLAKMSASILEFKLSTISYIMLLDKPAITWNHEEASELFDGLAALFELNERYGKNRHKIDTLMDITEVFSGLAHAKRSTRLEWAIIILIVIEVILSLYDLFFKKIIE